MKRYVPGSVKYLKNIFPRNLMLTSEGCQNCASCTYPDSPCRFPDKMYPSVESYGISVVNEAAAAGMHYINGTNTVTYFAKYIFLTKNKTAAFIS